MASLLATNIAVPAFFWFAGITALPLAFIDAVVRFPPVFVLLRIIRPRTGKECGSILRLPAKLIRYAVKADTDAVPGQSGKNEQTKKVLRALFILSKVSRPETEECRGLSNPNPEKTPPVSDRTRAAFFLTVAGLVPAEVAGPAAVREIPAAITGA